MTERWIGFDALGRSRLMAQIGATYFAAGGIMALLVTVLPDRPDDFSRTWFWAIGGAALTGAVMMLLGAGRIPVGAMHLIVAGGTVLVSLQVWKGGVWGTTLAVFYMTGTYPFTFFRRGVALAYVALIGMAYAVVLAATDSPGGDLGRWVLVMGTLTAIGLAFNWLVERLQTVQLELDDVNRTLEERIADAVAELREQADELASSRRRVVTAADAARRRIERDLHDGAQQHLVALAVKLRLLERVAATDPAAAALMAAEARSDVASTIEEVRSLAHGLYPALLADRGLEAALTAAAARSPLAVVVHSTLEDRLERDLEAAVYFCCLEAMQNAAKHAGECANLVIRLSAADGVLRFSVSDDGAGFPTGGRHAQGHGFVNMRDRLGAFGGRIEVTSSPGAGTSVRGSAPLATISGSASSSPATAPVA